MKSSSICWIKSPLTTLLSWVVLAGPGMAGEFRAGASIVDITPALGIQIVGNFGPMPAMNVHDPLHARALVVDDGTRKAAIVVCDLVGVRASVCEAARERIKEKIGIPGSHVLVTATHTHSAGNALGSLVGWFSGDVSAARELPTIGDPKEPLDEYQRFLASRIADSVIMAEVRLQPAEMAFGKVEIPEHVFNRRWSMKEGTMPRNPFGVIDKAKMNPPRASPDLVEPVGPTDPVLSLMAFRGTDGRLISLFASYPLHYVGGVKYGDISADYFGVFCEELTKLRADTSATEGTDFVPMLANGTSGDINNIDFRHEDPSFGLYEKMRIVGRDVAEKVHRVMDGLEWRKDTTVNVAFRTIPLMRKKMSPEMVKWAEETWKKPVSKGEMDSKKAYAGIILANTKAVQAVDVPIQYIRIGGTGIAALPGEVFAETGLEFKKRAPHRNSFMLGLSNDFLGYLPTPRQLELGGYETWPGVNNLEEGASEVMLRNVLEMADESER